MFAEKLLLHVLIILVPVFIYSFFYDRWKMGHSPVVIGLIQGVAAFLSMVFSYYSFGLYWDLRYVPLVLAFLYGGPIAGGIVCLTILGTRVYMGGDALYFGYFSCILASIVPFLFTKRFLTYPPIKRISVAILVGIWPAFISFSILFVYLYMGNTIDIQSDSLIYISLFLTIHFVSIGLAAMLEEVSIERQVMKQEIQQAEKLNTLGELAASIAHEVRNPLTVVKGFLQLLQQNPKEQNDYYYSLALSELARAETIINDYLHFAKPQITKPEVLDSKELLSDIHLLLEPIATRYGVRLEKDLEENVKIQVDRNHLQQALINIIKNGIEATDEGGQVTITSRTSRKYLEIVIEDTGKGMTKEQLKKIGTFFYTTRDKGTGLGTAVSIRIIEAMKGKVGYRSEPEKGTEVRITLPLYTE